MAYAEAVKVVAKDLLATHHVRLGSVLSISRLPVRGRAGRRRGLSGAGFGETCGADRRGAFPANYGQEWSKVCKLIQQEHTRQPSGEDVLDVPIPQIHEQIAEVIPQERV